MSDSVPLCMCHHCGKDCHLPDCQLLAYVKELERDKARLWGVLRRTVAIVDAWELAGHALNELGEIRRMSTAAMHAMKEGK